MAVCAKQPIYVSRLLVLALFPCKISTMTFNCKIYLCLCLFVKLFVDCQTTVPTQSPLPPPHCEKGLCSLDSGLFLIGEPLSGHIAPDAVIISLAEFPHLSQISLKVGDLYVETAEDIPKLGSAVLVTALVRSRTSQRFTRRIANRRTGVIFGHLIVERPVPDPDIRFESLANNSLLAGVPIGLRAEVDPASLIPSPTIGCRTDECVLIYPASVRILHLDMILSNNLLVGGRPLFRPRANEHGLSFCHSKSATFYHSAPGDHVREIVESTF